MDDVDSIPQKKVKHTSKESSLSDTLLPDTLRPSVFDDDSIGMRSLIITNHVPVPSSSMLMKQPSIFDDDSCSDGGGGNGGGGRMDNGSKGSFGDLDKKVKAATLNRKKQIFLNRKKPNIQFI